MSQFTPDTAIRSGFKRTKRIGVLITDDQPCLSCGYNLKGLMTAGRCPECGEPIHRLSRGTASKRDTLGDAPTGYLSLLGLGLVLMGCTCLLRLLDYIFQGFPPGTSDAVQICTRSGVAVLWYVGVLLILRKRPPTPDSATRETDAHGREWYALRIAVAASQLAVFGAGAAYTMYDLTPTQPAWWWVWMGFEVLTAAAWVPLCFYLARLCEWAPDESLATHLRNTGSGLVCAAVLFGLIEVCGVFLNAVPLFGLMRYMVLILTLGYPILVLYVMILLFRMVVMVSWAKVNANQRYERDARMAARAAERLAEMSAPAPLQELQVPPAAEPDAATLAAIERHQAETAQEGDAGSDVRQVFAGDRVMKPANATPYKLEGD